MGNLLKEMGRPQESVVELRKALKIRLKLLGAGHKDVGTTSNNLGCTLISLGRLEEALAHLNKALEIRLKVFGAGHQLVAETQSNLAHVLRNWARDRTQKRCFQRLLQVFGLRTVQITRQPEWLNRRQRRLWTSENGG